MPTPVLFLFPRRSEPMSAWHRHHIQCSCLLCASPCLRHWHQYQEWADVRTVLRTCQDPVILCFSCYCSCTIICYDGSYQKQQMRLFLQRRLYVLIGFQKLMQLSLEKIPLKIPLNLQTCAQPCSAMLVWEPNDSKVNELADW